MPRATLEFVAARAGVSRQTVSNVINAPHLVAPATAERVRSALDELDYRGALSVEYFDLPEHGWGCDDPAAYASALREIVTMLG